MLNVRRGDTFRDTSFFIDGGHFIDCTFINCQLIYQGHDEVDFDGCDFQNCEWTFDDAAGRTLGYLSTLNHKVGKDGQKLVGEIFEGLVDGRVANVRDINASATLKAESNMRANATVEKRAIAS